MQLTPENIATLEQWLEDPSFLGWAKQDDVWAVAQWDAHLTGHPELRELAEYARLHALGISFRQQPADRAQAEQSLARLLSKVERRKRKWTPHRSGALRVAAVIAVLLTLAGIGYVYFQTSEVVLATGYGEHLTEVLADGSIVTLNSNSRLTYQSANPRKVVLSGEAYFEVKRKPATGDNFQVITPDVEVTVLGTSFNVNTRNENTSVFLEEGKVDLKTHRPDAGLIIMEPGDLVTYSSRGTAPPEKRKHVPAPERVSWKNGTLIFNETPLAQALADIEAIYGVTFTYDPATVAGEAISGGVPVNDLAVVLQILREVNGLRIQGDGTHYTLLAPD